MHYQVAGLVKDLAAALHPVDLFLKEMGKGNVQSQAKLSVTKDKLPLEQTVVVLE
jgi:hypothetical protein